MQEFKIDRELCRTRQQRLLQVIRDRELQGAVVLQNAHVQWLTGVYVSPLLVTAAHLDADGKLTFIAPQEIPDDYSADLVESYDAKLHSTMRNDQNQPCVRKLQHVTGRLDGRIGVEFSSFGVHAQQLLSDNVEDIEPDLFALRRKKETDELAMIQHAIDATEKMYEVAREIVVPGISEIEVFNTLQTTAVQFLGEPLTGTGNDYQCGSRGGPPRNDRLVEAGELYILDLGPAFRGYNADNSRTLSVTEPTDEQSAAWEFIVKVFDHVENMVKPGKNCKELFQEVQAILDESPVGIFNHHLGHGIGLFPHESPHLNPNWNDSFEIGDVFTAEPGLYDVEKLKAGIRIENDYVVTENGIRKLTRFSMEL